MSGYDALTISSATDGVTIDLSAHDGGTILLEGFDMANLDAVDFVGITQGLSPILIGYQAHPSIAAPIAV